MTEADFTVTTEALKVIRYFKTLGERPKIVSHSGYKSQDDLIKELFTDADFISLKIADWNINDGRYSDSDLICFNNVFHYIADPDVAFKNVLDSCRYLLIQDLIIRDRGSNILGTDGDCMRYSNGEIVSNFKGSFDLKCMREKMILFYPYLENEDHIHFITLIKGNLE